MKLTVSEYQELSAALLEACGSADELAEIVASSGERLDDITPQSTRRHMIMRVIQHAESRDTVPALVSATRSMNPTNVRMLRVSAALGLEPSGLKDDVPTDERLTRVTEGLERMVDPDRGISDLGSYAIRVQELVRQVCAIEIGAAYGTGFLIGPETVLTNYHVVEAVIAGPERAPQVGLRFDYQRLRDGVATNAGVVVRLAKDWLVHAEPFSDLDLRPFSSTSSPAANELDYAVLRLERAIGSDVIDDRSGTVRGWLSPCAETFDFSDKCSLMIAQHPCHDPLSFDWVEAAVIRMNANRTRVHYRNNTLPGSSGSPVLNGRLELVALHHSGQPGGPDFRLPCKQQVSPADYNEGIPIDAIQASISSMGVSWVFGSVP